MSIDLAQLVATLLQYKYAILLPLTVIEGPIITIIAGLLVSLDQLKFFPALILVIIGDLIGDVLYYALGHWGKDSFFKRWGKFIGLNQQRISDIEKHFIDHSGKTLFTGKLSHGVGTVFLIAAGIARMPFLKFLWYNFLATLPKSIVLLLIGYYYGNALARINSILDFISALAFSLVIIILLTLFFYRKK